MRRIVIFFLLLLTAAGAGAAPPNKPSVPAAPKSKAETFLYDISYLCFDRLAEGRLTLSPGERAGSFRAELEARTLGVAGWLTGDRAHRYISLMESGPDGRFYFLSHESSIIKGKGKAKEIRGKRYLFDAARGEVRYQRLKEGKVSRETIIPVDRQAPPSDVLTAFVNFRSGFFGPIEAGRRYEIPTFSHKGNSKIVVETVSEIERRYYPSFPAGGVLARVTVDGEVFDTGGGHIFVWFDANGAPVQGMVEDVIGIGTVRGMLRRE